MLEADSLQTFDSESSWINDLNQNQHEHSNLNQNYSWIGIIANAILIILILNHNAKLILVSLKLELSRKTLSLRLSRNRPDLLSLRLPPHVDWIILCSCLLKFYCLTAQWLSFMSNNNLKAAFFLNLMNEFPFSEDFKRQDVRMLNMRATALAVGLMSSTETSVLFFFHSAPESIRIVDGTFSWSKDNSPALKR